MSDIHICAGYKFATLDSAKLDSAVPQFVASRACTKPESKQKNIEEQKAKWQETADQNLYTTRIKEFGLLVQYHDPANDYIATGSCFSPPMDNNKQVFQAIQDLIDLCAAGFSLDAKVHWYGDENIKLFTKSCLLACASQGFTECLADDEQARIRQLFYAVNHYEVDSLLNPSGVVTAANRDWQIARVAGSKNPELLAVAEALKGTNDVETQARFVEQLFASFGLVALTTQEPVPVGDV